MVGLTDSTGALNRAYEYGPAGGISGASAPSTLPTDYFRYRGAYYGSAQMYHFGMRDYDPALRRWTQQDPIDQAGDLRQANRYVYAGNDPVDMTDPTGQGFWSSVGDFFSGLSACRQPPQPPPELRSPQALATQGQPLVDLPVGSQAELGARPLPLQARA